MTYPTIFIIAFLLQVLETSVARYAGVNFVTPDVGLVAAIFLGVGTGPVAGLITAFFLGMTADLMSMGGLIGANAVIYVVVFLLAFQARNKVMVWAIPGQILLTIVFCFVALVLQTLFQFLFEHWVNVYADIWRVGLVGVLVTTASAPILFILFDRVMVAVSGATRGDDRVIK